MPREIEPDNLELRSEEVQEILTKPPQWLIRWGISLIFVFTLIIISLSFLIRYPDLVTAKVLVTTIQPIEKVNARYTGQIDQIFVKDQEHVVRDQILGVLRNTANYKDVLFLKSVIDTFNIHREAKFFPFDKTSKLVLGEVTSAYLQFEKDFTAFYLSKTLNPYENTLSGNRVAISEINKRMKNQQMQKKLLEQEFLLKQKNFERFRILYDKGVISKQDFEQKELENLQMKKNISSMAISISQMREAIGNANLALTRSYIDKEESEVTLLNNYIQSFNSLKETLRQWEYQYVFKTSTNGRVYLQEYWGKNQFVKSGSLVFTIIPNQHQELLGKLIVAPQNSGKIKVGQKVFVKLDNYPYQQYGMLLGEVASMSVATNEEGNYIVYVQLPNGTKTSHNKSFKFKQELLGQAEIVTEDLSVAARIFYSFKDLFKY